MSLRQVLVLNQFAMPRTEWGLTRHADLFGRLRGWSTCIVAANRDHYGQRTFTTTDPLFRLVSVPGYTGAGIRRVAGWALFAAKAVAIGLGRRRVDIVFASTPHLLAPVAGLAVARLRRVPFLLEVRDLWPESIVEAGHLRRGSRLHRLLVRCERYLYVQAARIVAVTPGWESHFRDLGVDTGKLVVIPNGAEPREHDLSDEERASLRGLHGIQGFTAVYAGAHGPANGLDAILDAAHKLPEISFLLVGAGSEKTRLQARARRENLRNVSFREPVPKSQVSSLLAACDVGVHVLAPWQLLQAGLSPNKVFDYLAAGIPIVSNCEAGLRAVVTDGQCGRVGGAEDLAVCLQGVWRSSAEQRRLWSTKGRELVQRQYSPTRSAEALERVLDECAGLS